MASSYEISRNIIRIKVAGKSYTIKKPKGRIENARRAANNFIRQKEALQRQEARRKFVEKKGRAPRPSQDNSTFTRNTKTGRLENQQGQFIDKAGLIRSKQTGRLSQKQVTQLKKAGKSKAQIQAAQEADQLRSSDLARNGEIQLTEQTRQRALQNEATRRTERQLAGTVTVSRPPTQNQEVQNYFSQFQSKPDVSARQERFDVFAFTTQTSAKSLGKNIPESVLITQFEQKERDEKESTLLGKPQKLKRKTNEFIGELPIITPLLGNDLTVKDFFTRASEGSVKISRGAEKIRTQLGRTAEVTGIDKTLKNVRDGFSVASGAQKTVADRPADVALTVAAGAAIGTGIGYLKTSASTKELFVLAKGGLVAGEAYFIGKEAIELSKIKDPVKKGQRVGSTSTFIAAGVAGYKGGFAKVTTPKITVKPLPGSRNIVTLKDTGKIVVKGTETITKQSKFPLRKPGAISQTTGTFQTVAVPKAGKIVGTTTSKNPYFSRETIFQGDNKGVGKFISRTSTQIKGKQNIIQQEGVFSSSKIRKPLAVQEISVFSPKPIRSFSFSEVGAAKTIKQLPLSKRLKLTPGQTTKLKLSLQNQALKQYKPFKATRATSGTEIGTESIPLSPKTFVKTSAVIKTKSIKLPLAEQKALVLKQDAGKLFTTFEKQQFKISKFAFGKDVKLAKTKFDIQKSFTKKDGTITDSSGEPLRVPLSQQNVLTLKNYQNIPLTKTKTVVKLKQRRLPLGRSRRGQLTLQNPITVQKTRQENILRQGKGSSLSTVLKSDLSTTFTGESGKGLGFVPLFSQRQDLRSLNLTSLSTESTSQTSTRIIDGGIQGTTQSTSQSTRTALRSRQGTTQTTTTTTVPVAPLIPLTPIKPPSKGPDLVVPLSFDFDLPKFGEIGRGRKLGTFNFRSSFKPSVLGIEIFKSTGRTQKEPKFTSGLGVRFPLTSKPKSSKKKDEKKKKKKKRSKK